MIRLRVRPSAGGLVVTTFLDDDEALIDPVANVPATYIPASVTALRALGYRGQLSFASADKADAICYANSERVAQATAYPNSDGDPRGRMSR